MTEWVVDCSLVMGWCLPDEASPISDRFFAGLPEPGTLRVPALFWYEVANTLTMARRRDRISAAQANRLRTLVCALPLETAPATPQTATRLTHLAALLPVSAYDAAYIDLARRTNAGLATLDRTLHEAAEQAGIPVLAGAHTS